MTTRTKKAQPQRSPKVVLTQSTYSELVAAYKFTPAELRRAKAAVAAAMRGGRRVSDSVKREEK